MGLGAAQPGQLGILHIGYRHALPVRKLPDLRNAGALPRYQQGACARPLLKGLLDRMKSVDMFRHASVYAENAHHVRFAAARRIPLVALD